MSGLFHPKVSIIIPVYNGLNYMREAIDSALAQTYDNIEVLVINDGSCDEGATDTIARSYGDKIRYFYKENGGVATALNMGIEKMEGEYFSWLSHDDKYKPEKVECQVRKLSEIKSEYPDAIIYCGYSTISEKGEVIRDYFLPPYITQNIRCLIAIDVEFTLNGCALLIPKVLFERIGAFKKECKYTQDYDLWFRFSESVKFMYLNDNLVLSRQHSGQDSKTANNNILLQECDLFHYRIVSELLIEEIESYLQNDTNKLINIYKIYKDSKFYATAIAILLHITKLLQKQQQQKLECFINQEILQFEDSQYSIIKNEFNKCIKTIGDKPTVMIYCNVWVYGGIERVWSILIEELVKSYNIILVSENMLSNQEGFDLSEDVIHIKLNHLSNEGISYRLAALAKITGTSLFIGNPNIIIELLPIYKMLRDIDIKSIAVNHCHYFLPYYTQWLYPVALQRIEFFKYANAVTWLTSFNSGIYSQLANNGVVMPNPNTFNSVCEYAEHQNKNILCVGRFYDSIKRLDRILLAFSRVYKEDPEAKLVLVGGYDLKMIVPDESGRTIEKLLKTINLPKDSIEFCGEKEYLTEYYKNAALLLMTSDNEGFGMVLNEAGAFGVPVVMFEIPGLEDIIEDGKNGFIVKQDDYKVLTEKIVLILNNRELRLQMGATAKEMVKRFSRNVVCRRWNDLCEAILNTDNVENLNNRLKEEFLIVPSDSQRFLRQTVESFEFYSKKMIQEYISTNLILSQNKSIVSKVIRHLRTKGFKETYRVVRVKLKEYFIKLK